MNSLGPRRLRARKLLKKLKSEQLELVAPDGTRLRAELDCAANPNGAIVILLHGWEGSSKSPYLVTTAGRLLGNGFDVLRLNLRDHGDTHHLNRELFNSTRTPEVAGALKNFLDGQSYAKVFLAGFSLGGSFALRIAADHGKELGLQTAIGVCPPVDPASVMDTLNNGLFVYENYFFRRWARSLRNKLASFPELDYGPALAAASSIDDLNAFFVPRFTQYEAVADYFSAYALTGDRLRSLAIPAYLITSEDDPIIPVEDLDKINVPELLHIERHRYGGHCAFVEDLTADSWVEKRLVEIFLGFMN